MHKPKIVSKRALSIITSGFVLVLFFQVLPVMAKICGQIEDDGGVGLAAGVEVWNSYPDGKIIGETCADMNGYFCVEIPATVDAEIFDFRLILQGYCTMVEEGITRPTADLVFVMSAVPKPAITPYVADYWGANTMYRGYPVRPGDVIIACDPDGVVCGVGYVRYAGMYVIHVYGDDGGTTPNLDEGAVNGNEITFYLNCEYPLVAANTWANHASYEEDLTFAGVFRRPIPVCSPWILMSYNVEIEDQSRGGLLSPIDGRYTRVISLTCMDGAISWDATRPPSLNDLSVMDNSHGYWLYTDGLIDTFWVTGVPVPPDTPIELCAGWNAVSYLPNAPDAPIHAWASIAGEYTYAFGFECGFGARTYHADRPADLNDLTCLAPGYGYWIEMSNPATLVYPSSGYSCPAPPISTARPVNLTGKVTPTPRVCDFWSSGGAEDPSAGSILTVRDEQGITCGEGVIGEDGAFMVHVYGDESRTSVDEGADDGSVLTLECNGQVLEVAGEAIWIEHGSVEITLTTSGWAAPVPDAFELHQNYPNPFNARTAISFNLPAASGWELCIYDVVGRVVEKLNGHAAAGRVIVTWETPDSASGMYFYRLTAGEFTQTRKMTLLK